MLIAHTHFLAQWAPCRVLRSCGDKSIPSQAHSDSPTAPPQHSPCRLRAATNREINRKMFCTVLGSEMEKMGIKNDLLHSILHLPLKAQHSDGHISSRHFRGAPDSQQLSWLIHSVHPLCICQQFRGKSATKPAAHTASSPEQLQQDWFSKEDFFKQASWNSICSQPMHPEPTGC